MFTCLLILDVGLISAPTITLGFEKYWLVQADLVHKIVSARMKMGKMIVIGPSAL